MNRYWAHIVISDTEEWEGDVIKADEVDAELKKKDEEIGRLNKALKEIMNSVESVERYLIAKKALEQMEGK